MKILSPLHHIAVYNYPRLESLQDGQLTLTRFGLKYVM